jgi:hypothetical protein
MDVMIGIKHFLTRIPQTGALHDGKNCEDQPQGKLAAFGYSSILESLAPAPALVLKALFLQDKLLGRPSS